MRTESSFMRFRRIDGGGWEAQTPDGIRLFGEAANARGERQRHLPLGVGADDRHLAMSCTTVLRRRLCLSARIRYNFGENNGGGPVCKRGHLQL
ncbi:MAG: hypothetical protein R2932_43110 [Caldilineaceae bacterium]